MISRLRATICVTFFVLLSAADLSAGPEEGLFFTAKIIYESAQEQPDELKVESYLRVRMLLDRIVSEHPESDLAVRILLQDTIDGLDVAQLEESLRENSALIASTEGDAEEQMEEVPEVPEATVSAADVPRPLENAGLPEEELEATATQYIRSDETTESALDLTRNEIRDLQARLLVMGHDPNGVDGVLGRGTRAAVRAWQSSIGAISTGFMSSELLEILETESEDLLQIWLQDPANQRAYRPPPPIALGPGNMSGTWSYTTRCGVNSRMPNTQITGSLTMRHAGGSQYSGTLTNSQGLRANLVATLNGRTVNSTANFGLLLGRVNLTARVDDQQLVLRGQDSNRCSFYASK